MRGLTIGDPSLVANTAFNPLASSFGWLNAYWAEDPNWTNPGDGNPVSSWRDAGTELKDVSSTLTARPTFRSSVAALNNKPALEFDGTNDNLISATASTPGTPQVLVAIFNWRSATIAASEVIFHTASAHLQMFIDGTNNDTVFVAGTGTAIGTTNLADDVGVISHIAIGIINGASSILDYDGVTIAAGDGGTGTAGNLRAIGSTVASTLFGDMNLAFMAVGTLALTSQQRIDLHVWAQNHYGTP